MGDKNPNKPLKKKKDQPKAVQAQPSSATPKMDAKKPKH